MAGILPIPTTRVSDYLARTRLVQQIQSDQADLLRLESQLSTGRRIFLPSDDPGASLRAITLQRTLERKEQLQTNVAGAVSRITSAESALQQVTTTLNTVSSTVRGVIGTPSSEGVRLKAIDTVNQALDTLTRFANTRYLDTYLFGGTRSLDAPYVFNGDYVEYRGNEANLQSHVDVNYLFDTNISGHEVFGGVSDAVRGSGDLNLQASAGTFLSQLNGGDGVSSGGAIELVTGLTSTVIDLSGAYTLGDVARLIEQGAPEGSGVRVDVGPLAGGGTGLRVTSAGGDPVAIREVSGGRTAQELGILQETAVTTPIGGDVDPVIRKTTALDDLLGTKSRGRLEFAGANNDIRLVAKQNGASLDGLNVTLTDGAAPGGESLTYAAGPPPTLDITIAEGDTTAAEIVELINSDPSSPFTASVDPYDAEGAGLAGTGAVTATTFNGVTSGGGGTSLDLASGLRITNGGAPIVVDTTGAATVEDLLNTLNRPENGIVAQVNARGDGIDIRTRRAGADFSIGENGGVLATQLGVRTYASDTRLEDFNRGVGVAIEEDINRDYTLKLDHDDGAGGVTTYRINLSDDAVADLSNLTAPPTGSLDTVGNFDGGAAAELTIAFAEDSSAANHTASLSGDTLTVTVGTNGLAPSSTLDIDQVFQSITDADFAETINYTAGDLSGAYTVGDDAGATITFSGGGAPTTVGDVVDRINSATGGAVTAQIASIGNGLELTYDNSSGQTLRAYGGVAERLGFFDAAADQEEALDGSGTLASEDRHTLEADSVFNTLIRLREVLAQDDPAAASGAELKRLEEDIDRATFARSDLGSRLQTLDVLKTRLEDEDVQLRSALSDEIDVDMAEVISDFTARQFALQASLQTTANLLQLTVLNYI